MSYTDQKDFIDVVETPEPAEIQIIDGTICYRRLSEDLSEGTPVWIYSVTYNGSYMLAETVVSTVVICLLSSVLDFKTLRRPKAEVK